MTKNLEVVVRTPKLSEMTTDLSNHAADSLHFIRRTMERASAFTALPGLGLVAIGLTALPAAWLASRAATRPAWLGIWLIEATLAVTIGFLATWRKTRNAGESVFSGAARRFLLTFTLPAAVGLVLTPVFYRSDLVGRLPGMWLLLYGTGVAAAGAFSVRLVPFLGGLFIALGVAALFLSVPSGDAFMALGFGGLHIAFGLVIARRYGG